MSAPYGLVLFVSIGCGAIALWVAALAAMGAAGGFLWARALDTL